MMRRLRASQGAALVRLSRVMLCGLSGFFLYLLGSLLLLGLTPCLPGSPCSAPPPP